MKQRFARYKPTYGQRWQVETVNSMIKRRLGSALRARQYRSQCREIILKAVANNVMIAQIYVFYGATASLFPSPIIRRVKTWKGRNSQVQRDILALERTLDLLELRASPDSHARKNG